MSLELEGFNICGDLSKQMAQHAVRVEAAWKLTNSLVEQGANSEANYEKISAKFDVWTAWYTPRQEAAKVLLNKLRKKAQGKGAKGTGENKAAS